jgi:hypothetical protein
MQDMTDIVMDWLVGSYDLLGVTIYNWILAIGGGLLLYFAVMAMTQRRQARMR